MAVATAALSVSLDVGDRLSQEFRSLGANLVVTPEADSLPLEIGGVDFRPANSGAYLPESDLPKIKSVFWHNNITAFAPEQQFTAESAKLSGTTKDLKNRSRIPVIGTWVAHPITLSDGSVFTTGIDRTNSWWKVDGRWFAEGKRECVVGTKSGPAIEPKSW